ncbi:hypothetical protein CA265_09425 [Sphingobacteriaceae bacterium GW460-11-11-14-LB5]|nr:hypothetical protein CA265_09425 [Sphingobacteriaceae bacterium GW460-11-11-14-LB5]
MGQFVTQEVYIQHYQDLLATTRKRIIDEFQTLNYYQMDALEHRVGELKKKVGFARSGKQTAFYIDG